MLLNGRADTGSLDPTLAPRRLFLRQFRSNAQKLGELFGFDSTKLYSGGCHLYNWAHKMGAQLEYGMVRHGLLYGYDIVGVDRQTYLWDLVRCVFTDGSAIVVISAFATWDIEGSDPWSFSGICKKSRASKPVAQHRSVCNRL